MNITECIIIMIDLKLEKIKESEKQ